MNQNLPKAADGSTEGPLSLLELEKRGIGVRTGRQPGIGPPFPTLRLFSSLGEKPRTRPSARKRQRQWIISQTVIDPLARSSGAKRPSSSRILTSVSSSSFRSGGTE